MRIPAHVVDPCMLVKPGSDLRCKSKNKQDTHGLLENLSASIRPDIRRLNLVYRNTELLDHPQHEALILPLSATFVVRQLVLLNLYLCRWCSLCLAYVCIAGLNQALL